MKHAALLIIDVQNDFLPGGALAVKDGDQVIPVINALQDKFDLIVATQDWHPASHGSFAANNPGKQPGELAVLNGLPQVMWPVHCVQNTFGAEFSTHLNTTKISKVFQKGTDPKIDSYSGFFDNGKLKSTGLSDYLKSINIQELFVAGLATDYCVKFTVLHALELGFKVSVIIDGVRAVNLNPGDSELAFQEMLQHGASLIHSNLCLL
jgi:nicotinamidase/pyrazinamidase